MAVAVEGATWSYPTQLDGVQPGDEVLVYAELPAETPLRIRVDGGEAKSFDTTTADAPLVERAWAQAKIASLEAEERDHGKSPDLQKQILDLSIQKRVLSEYTALLVLETDWDYARFQIDRKALGDILAVRDGRLLWSKHGDAIITDKASPRLDVPTLATKSSGPDEDTSAAIDGIGAGLPRGYASGGGAARMATRRPVLLPSAAGGPSSESAAASTAPMERAAESPAAPPAQAHHAPSRPAMPMPSPQAFDSSGSEQEKVNPFTGKFKQVQDHLGWHDAKGARELAAAWQAASPGDVLALVALGEASEAAEDLSTAARAYGSIVDLFASRADLRRFAGERLEHMHGDVALDLAIDTFDKARRDRPDHPASHRLSAYARVRKGDFEGAFDVMAAGSARHYPEGRFLGVDRILREDLGLIAAAWIAAEPARRAEIMDRLHKAGGTVESGPSLRFVLNWETDANDVDFHIHDASGGHAYYASKQLPSGGDLYADVTTGYGPECFTVRQARGHRAGPYKLQAHYYSRGPMGYGMGKLEIIDHDGHGHLKFDERPFVIMVDHAFVDLGTAS